MNRRLSITVASAVIALSALAACGGGGGGSSPTPPVGVVPTTVPVTSAPPATPRAVVTPVPAPPAPIIIGLVPATGPVTTMSGPSGGFGSTILNGTDTAVFVAQNATTPDVVEQGGSLQSSLILVSETVGQSTSTRARSAQALRPAQPFVRDADFRRRPDVLDLHDKMRTIVQSLRQTAYTDRSSQSTRRTQATPQNFQVGQSFVFHLQAGNISGTSTGPATKDITAHLISRSNHSNIWLDDADANPIEYPNGFQADMDVVAARFEENYNIETVAFGGPYTTRTVPFRQCDASGTELTTNTDPGTDTTGNTDPEMNVVITDALAGTGEGGYFFGADMLSQSQANCISGTPKIVVNNLKMFVMASDKNTPSPGFLANNEFFYLNETVPQTMAHEYQHYLHYVNKVLQQIVSDPNQLHPSGTFDNSFIDEGCSVLAQDLVVTGNNRNVGLESETPLFVRIFLLEPDLYSLTSFSGYQPDPGSSSATAPYGYYHNNAGNYGLSYLFVRYLYDRFNQTAALKKIYGERFSGTGVDVGPAVAAAGGEQFTPLFNEFAAALAVHAGGSGPEITTDPKFSFSSSVVLRGPTATYSRRNGITTRNIVQPGPENPEIFVNNQPSLDARSQPLRQTLTPGQTITVNLIAGASLFVTPTLSPPTGATLRASGNVPLFQGALGQGPIPTPPPSYT